MRRYFGIIFSSIIFFLTLVSAVFAQSPRRFYDWSSTLELENQQVLGLSVSTKGTAKESTPGSSQNFLKFNRYLFLGNLTPDNPFHFLKTIQEEIQLAATANPQDKDRLKISIAGERLDEAQQLAKKGNSQGVQAAAAAYGQTMKTVATDIERMKKSNQNIDSLIKLVDLETAKHTVVFEKVAVLAPQQAKQAVMNAVSSSELNGDKLADLTNRPALPADMIDRLSALKAQGLLTEEEVNKIIGIKTRTEAREELKKFVQGGIIPEADFLRMDENVKNYFPKDFYEIHEIKRFYTLKKLEEEKPNQITLTKIQEFAKTYKPGDTVPPDIRKYWGPIVHLEEIQTTFRPDLISSDLFRNNQGDNKKFTEIVERLKPRPEDLAFLGNYLAKNKTSIDNLPPEYQRMYNLGNVYGAQCGTGQKWFKSSNGIGADGTGGYCAAENFKQNIQVSPNPSPINCTGNIVSAKNPITGACSAYPADCLPTGWTVVGSCISNTATTTQGNPTKINCPTNAHFVSVPYDPSGGYCIPNYTPIYEQRDDQGNFSDTPCPVGYHRNYQGGACLPDTSTNFLTGPLPPISANPGPYPQPFYPPLQRCSSSQHWVPEPINPQGGYCIPDNYNYNNYNQPGGGATPNPQADTPNRQTQEANCRAGGGVCVSWTNGACGCERIDPKSSCRPPDRGCETGKAWDQAACTCRDNYSYPSVCTYPSAGCQPGYFWDRGTCTCRPPCSSGTSWNGSYCMKDSSSGGNSSSTSSSCSEPSARCGANFTWDRGTCTCKPSCPSGTSWSGSYCMKDSSSSGGGSTSPPSGYGSCSQGQYWNGSGCVNNQTSSSGGASSPSREDQEAACRSGGGTCVSWVNGACGCERSGSSNSQPAPTSGPQSQPTSPPSQPTQPPPPPPTSGTTPPP